VRQCGGLATPRFTARGAAAASRGSTHWARCRSIGFGRIGASRDRSSTLYQIGGHISAPLFLKRECDRTLSQHPGLRGRTPVIFGGHEHDIFIEESGLQGPLIVKVGQDVEQIGFVDLWWGRGLGFTMSCTAVFSIHFWN
jgi:hypothetical protein